MFKKNDKLLPAAPIIADITAITAAILIIVLNIIFCVNISLIYLIYLFAGLLFTFVIWYFCTLFINLLADVKFIRNGIYDEPNDELKSFFSTDKNSNYINTKDDIITNKLINIKKLLDSGIITQEEYEEKKREIMEE